MHASLLKLTYPHVFVFWLQVKIGMTVHIPKDIFPTEECPTCGYWVGKVVRTSKGGKGDVGIFVEGEAEVFTQPKWKVAKWLA